MAKIQSEYKPLSAPSVQGGYGSSDGLGVKIETVLIRMLQRVVTWGWEFFADVMVYIFDVSMKILKPGMMRVFGPILTEIENTPGVPANIKAMITRAKDEQGEAGAGAIMIIVGMAVNQLVSAALQPISTTFTQSVNSFIKPNVVPASVAAQAFNMGLIDEVQVQAFLDLLGIADKHKGLYVKLTKTYTPLSELLELRRRGLIDDAGLNERMTLLAIRPEDRDAIRELVNFIPPVNDLIRFMVREAFNEEVVQKFSYDADYPQEIDKYLPMVGLTADWGKRYWRAHWALPSPTQAYEMLHRGLISQDDLRTLLKTADYPEFWRDRLMNMSYELLTRVDLRRMYQAKLIGRDKVKETYLKRGYNEEDAELLTKFAEQGVSNDEKDLSRADVVSSYEDNLTDRASTAEALVKMGYDSQEAEAILKLADYNIAKALRSDVINYVGEQYRARKIDKGAVTAQLTAAGLKQTSIDRYLLQWDRLNDNDVKLPSLADAKRWRSDGLIDEPKFREILGLLKYSTEYIDLYVLETNNAISAKRAGA